MPKAVGVPALQAACHGAEHSALLGKSAVKRAWPFHATCNPFEWISGRELWLPSHAPPPTVRSDGGVFEVCSFWAAILQWNGAVRFRLLGPAPPPLLASLASVVNATYLVNVISWRSKQPNAKTAKPWSERTFPRPSFLLPHTMCVVPVTLLHFPNPARKESCPGPKQKHDN